MAELTLLPPRSFFVGPTAVWRKKERRRRWRILVGIVARGDTETVELVMCLHLLGACLTFAGATGDAVLGNTEPYAVFYGSLCVLGLTGLLTRNLPLRASFGGIGTALRIWMAACYFQHNPHDAQWWGHASGGFWYAWIAIRCSCRYGALSVQRGALSGLACQVHHLTAWQEYL